MANDTKQTDEIGTPPDTAAAFAAKANDLEALRAAVVDAASVGAALWFSYILVLLYLFIAVGSVTHRDLLFENPVKLPFLNVDLPLTGFFWLGPALFLTVHAYVLLHLVLLADKVGAFHAELEVQIHDDDAKVRLRRQLPSNIFVQFLAGPKELRTGVIGFMLRLIAQLSLIVGPLALLVFFQFQFLPTTTKRSLGGSASPSSSTWRSSGSCGPRSRAAKRRCVSVGGTSGAARSWHRPWRVSRFFC
jgi:hypothetical protein